MKTKLRIIFLLSMFLMILCLKQETASAQGVTVGFQVFYDELSPYGNWVYNPNYGYVWIPDVDPGFVPYSTNGYWIITDEGWTWISDYPWGWAPFHYGRWYIDPAFGAIWVPDNEWGPGWVTWRRSAGFYGWAPIGPGISITMAYSSDYYVPYHQWTFVRDRDFGRTNINKYYINNSYNVTIINNSTVINNTRVDRSRNVIYNTGPERTEVEKRSGRRFAPVAIRESNKPGQNMSNNQLQIYRPQVQKNISSGSKPAPSRVVRLENVKTSAERKSEMPAQKANQSTRQQPSRQQPGEQPGKNQPKQQQRPDQPAKQQPQAQPAKQQRPDQPAKQQPQAQPAKQQRPDQPAKQQPQAQPAKQKQPEQQQSHPAKNVEKDKESQPAKPHKTMGK